MKKTVLYGLIPMFGAYYLMFKFFIQLFHSPKKLTISFIVAIVSIILIPVIILVGFGYGSGFYNLIFSILEMQTAIIILLFLGIFYASGGMYLFLIFLLQKLNSRMSTGAQTQEARNTGTVV